MIASERAMKLMAYADGELDGVERAEVESWLATDAEAARFVNEVAYLGDLVSTGFAESTDAKAVAAFDVAAAVVAKVEAPGPAKVVSLAAESQARARAKRPRPVAYRAAGGVIAALALAASVFIMTKSDEQPMAPIIKPGPVAVVEPAPSVSSSTEGMGAGLGVDINVAESPDHSVSVLYLPSENALTTSVVLWVDETGEKK